MCNPPPVVKKIASVASAVFPVVGLANHLVANAAKGNVNPTTAVKQTSGDISSTFHNADPLNPPPPPAPPPVDTTTPPGGGGDSGPQPTPTGPAPTETAAMAAKRRLAALRMGLLSTIATSGQGVTSAPSLFAPSAFAVGATGTKTALGQ